MKKISLEVAEQALAHDLKPEASVVTPHDSPAYSEAAQDKFQAALTTFQTERRDRVNLSLNGLTDADNAASKENPCSEDR